jgi:hypothetical protein
VRFGFSKLTFLTSYHTSLPMILRHSLFACMVTFLLSGCEKKPGPGAAADSLPPATDTVITVDSMATPESAIHDTAQDLYLVSNINGNPSDVDNNGFISRVRPDGSVANLRFIAGGINGVTLNAPKGMALRGDSLWVSDITAVRVFNARTGASLATFDLARQGAVFLNDIAAGPDGSIYITDTGVHIANGEFSHPGPDRVFRIASDGKVTAVLAGPRLGQPNGLAWDASSNRMLLAPLGDSTIYAFAPGDTTLTPVVKGPGSYDGIEVLGGGEFIVSSHAVASILLYRGGALTALIDSLQDPADIGFDRKRGRVLIPSLGGNRLEIRSLPLQ